jgi:PKD repeat protein
MVTIQPTPDPIFTAPPVCLGGTTVFTNTTPQIPNHSLTYQWDFGDTNTSTLTNPTHTYSSAGTFNVSLTATTVGTLCSATIQQPVIVHPLPSQPSPIQFN